ncbi:MAG: NitT/TauT family transport system permease protein [Acidimicrobiaceae bacterium]|nr:NitT/TauT family transport system permease protein [Acidimicrobiaceae bacterium]
MTAAPEPEPPARARWLRSLVPPVAGVVLFLAVWQGFVRVFSIRAFVLPAPTEIFRHLASDPGFYVRNARVTLWEAGLGFGLGLLLALAAATVMAHVRVIEQAALPLVLLVQVTPIVAYAPAVVIWLGFGLKPILLITSLVCFVPFLVNAVTGFRSIDPDAAELMHSVSASRREVFFLLRVPHALPYLFSAARIAVGLALIGAVLGEYFAGVQSGLGYAVKVAQARSLVDQLWGSIYVLGFLGGVAVLLIAALERVMLRWHSSQIAAN